MRKYLTFAAVGAAALSLVACSSISSFLTGPTATAVVANTVLPPAAVQQLAATCASAGPLLTTATASTMPASVSQTAAYVESFCQQLAVAPAGSVPATTDANTPTWMMQVLSAVQTAAQIAGVVLPALLPVL